MTDSELKIIYSPTSKRVQPQNEREMRETLNSSDWQDIQWKACYSALGDLTTLMRTLSSAHTLFQVLQQKTSCLIYAAADNQPPSDW